MLLGLCGAKGSGKTTVAHLLCGKTTHIKPWPISPSTYVSEQLGVSHEKIRALMQEWIDPNWEWSWCSQCISDIEGPHAHWQSVSLADPLKRVCAVLFHYPYHILLGETEEARDIRERLTTCHYEISGPLTGRQLLQYFGTEVIRNNLGGTFWADLAQKEIVRLQKLGYNVIIPDVRFPDEANMLREMGGKLVLISRFQDEKKDTHVSESFWKTLPHDMVIENEGTLHELKIKLDLMLRSLNQKD